MLELYGYVRSRSDRPHWALEEIGVDYTFFQLNFRRKDNRSPTFLALNPGGKMPVLRHDDLVLTESGAICNYLGDTFPDSGLVPRPGSAARAHYDRWMFFIMTELEQPLWNKGKHILGRLPEELRVPAIMNAALWEWNEALALLEQGLAGKDYLVDNRFSMVDICTAHTLTWADRFEFPIESATVRAYWDRLRERPAFARFQQKETLEIPRPDLET